MKKNGLRKKGGKTILRWQDRLGALPATYFSTSRDPNQPSKILFFRLPKHSILKHELELGGDVEVIQNHHRHAVVWPSIHPNTGRVYWWYSEDGRRADPPKIDELAVLPLSWLESLSSDKSHFSDRQIFSGDLKEWFDWLDKGEPSRAVRQLRAEFRARDKAHIGHDELLQLVRRIHALQWFDSESGCGELLDEVVAAYLAETNERNPSRELEDICRWVIGSDWWPKENWTPLNLATLRGRA